MKLRTSFCNGTILKKNLTRFWPIWSLLALLLFISYPLSIMNSYDEVDSLLSKAEFDLPLSLIFFSITIAGCIFSYLHKSRSAIMMHAFPVSRGCLYRSGVLSGLLVFIVPWTIAMLLIIGISPEDVMLVWLYGVLFYLCFYGFAVFCMHISGKTLASIAIFFGIAIIPSAMALMVENVIKPLMYGVSIAGETVEITTSEYVYEEVRIDIIGAGFAGLIGVGLLFFAGWLYRKRHMENTGSFVAYRKAMPIFKYILTAFAGLFLNDILFSMIFGEMGPRRYLLGMLVLLLIGGLIGYFGAEMLLKKTLRVFQKKAFLGYGIFALIITLTFCALYFDVFNVVSYVPPTERIESVTISVRDATFTIEDWEDKEKLCEIHEELIALKNENMEYLPYYSTYSTVDLCYHVDEKVVRRKYSLYTADTEYILKRLNELLDTEKYAAQYYDRVMEEAVAGFYVREYGKTSKYLYVDREKLFAAMLQDVAEGNLPVIQYTYSDIVTWTYEITWYDKNDYPYDIQIPKAAKHTVEYLEQCLNKSEP